MVYALCAYVYAVVCIFDVACGIALMRDMCILCMLYAFVVCILDACCTHFVCIVKVSRPSNTQTTCKQHVGNNMQCIYNTCTMHTMNASCLACFCSVMHNYAVAQVTLLGSFQGSHAKTKNAYNMRTKKTCCTCLCKENECHVHVTSVHKSCTMHRMNLSSVVVQYCAQKYVFYQTTCNATKYRLYVPSTASRKIIQK